jgi:hypothetical protein
MSTNINEEQNGNGSRGSDGFMSDDEINRLAEEGAKLLPFENYCEQILFKESLQMEQADKERAWRTYLAYNVKAKNEGRKSTLNIEEYAQQAKKMAERTQETWQKFLPLKTNLSSALKNWMKAGQKLQETWEEQDFKKWQQKATRIVELMFPPKAKVSSNEKSADELRKEALERYTNLDASFPSPMEREAFYGVFGEVVSIIEPISEASPEAVLAQLIIALGNVMGRGAYRYQGSRHHLNEFGVIVGKTSRGRKGTSWKAVENLLDFIAPEWLSDRVMNGIQSGEAIVYAVRDEREGVVPIEKRKKGGERGDSNARPRRSR